jgi:uncharacterized protein (TIGR00156 family)
MSKTFLPLFLPLFLALSLVADPSAAQFSNPSQHIVSTKEAKSLRDDSPVVMRGRIEKSLGDEKYLFVDAEGSIKVEIDNEDFRGIKVAPSDTIEIRGEVDAKLLRDNEIDVDYLEKLNVETVE